MDRVEIAGLSVAEPLARFLKTEVFPGAGVASRDFWAGYAAILRDLGPRLKGLLARRDELQAKIDGYHRSRRGQPLDQPHYLGFLREIGYLLPEAEAGTVSTANVDPEIAGMAGPQLVVPMSNARYALNAANARWGSLYDALYGTDAVPHEGEAAVTGKGYNEARGALVIAKAKAFLDAAVPLAGASYADLAGLAIAGGGWKRRSRTAAPSGWRSPAPSWATPATRPSRRRCCCATTASASSSPSTARRRSAAPIPRASATWCSNPPSPPSWTWRIRSRWWTPTTRSTSTATGSASWRARCRPPSPRGAGPSSAA